MSIHDSTIQRRALLFGVPAAYLVLTLLHPFENPDLGDETDLWMVLHVIQLILIGGMACVIWVLTDGNEGRSARVARAMILPYVISYATLDAMAGLAAGSMVRVGNDLTESEQVGAGKLIDTMNDGSAAGLVFYVFVILSWVVAMGATVVSLRGRAPTPALVLLGLGVLVFGLGHPRPVGPVGMALFLAGMLWLELRPGSGSQRSARDGVDRPVLRPGV